MRTKTLLLAAVLSAAGIASSLAQVYSVNVVGYVNYPAKAPFSLIANPLDNKVGNNLNNILPSAPLAATIFRWTGTTFESSVNFGTWSPDLTLAPGEGFFISLATDTTLTFVGEVMQGSLTTPVPAGLSIKASQVPQSTNLAALNFPAGLGDTVFFYRNGTYVSSVYFGFWDPDLSPAVGEAFWVNNAGAAKSWTRNFTVQ
jgi:hypothetical protein